MKTVAYFSDYTLELADEKRKVDAIRELTQADRIVSVMSHSCLQNGLLPSEPSNERAQKGLDAGANLILQMSSYASLSSLGIYAFAAARFLDQLNLVDEVVFEVDDTNLEELTQIVYLLIANTRDFQQKVTRYRNSGMVFNDAQAKAIGEAVPGGEEMMKSWHNHFAVECMRALKILYSNIKFICMPRIASQADPSCHTTLGSLTTPHKICAPESLSQTLKDTLTSGTTDLSDYYGGYESLSLRIKKHLDQYEDFLQFADLIAGTDKDLFDIRKFFLRVAKGVSKSTVGVWRLYDFTPYCQVHTDTDETYQAAKASSSIFLFRDASEVSQMDGFKQEMWQKEQLMS